MSVSNFSVGHHPRPFSDKRSRPTLVPLSFHNESETSSSLVRYSEWLLSNRFKPLGWLPGYVLGYENTVPHLYRNMIRSVVSL